MDETLASESRIIFTSRNQCYSHLLYNVSVLDIESAKQLFLGYAFRDHTDSAKDFQRLTNAIVEKCDGLPLALEVTGKFLGTSKNHKVWEQTLHAMDTAKDHPDIDERLYGKLRASFDGLDETLQQMFLDAATWFDHSNLDNLRSASYFFRYEWHTFTLGEAKVAWRAAYDCEETVFWKKLVDLSLVYETGERERIRMHEQLRSLGKKIASEPKYGRWITRTRSKLLQVLKDSHEKVQYLSLMRYHEM
jgi:hypothetical protein